MPRPSPRTGRLRSAPRALVVAAAVVLALVPIAPAWAHVTVSPATVAPGATTELTFRVPNEQADASTVELQIKIPTQHPIAQLLARPVPGWTIHETTTKLTKPLVTDDGSFTSVVSVVTWTGGHIPPGQYQDFTLSADPMPDKPTTLVFKALQTYSNGDVVRWIDVPHAGQPEPEHPAPTLKVTNTSSNQTDNHTDNQADSPMVMTTPSADHTSRTTATVAWVGLALSLLAIVLTAACLTQLRRRPSD